MVCACCSLLMHLGLVQVAVLSFGDFYDPQFVKLYTIFMVQLQVDTILLRDSPLSVIDGILIWRFKMCQCDCLSKFLIVSTCTYTHSCKPT